MGEILTLTLTLIVQYGLPSVALCAVVWASATGKIVWKPTLDAKEQQIADLKATLTRTDADKQKALDGWVTTLESTKTVAGAAAKAVDMSERRNDS